MLSERALLLANGLAQAVSTVPRGGRRGSLRLRQLSEVG